MLVQCRDSAGLTTGEKRFFLASAKGGYRDLCQRLNYS